MIKKLRTDYLFPERRIRTGFGKKWKPDRDQISNAVQKFLDSGKTIKTIKTNPSNGSPRVMGDEWDQTSEGLENHENFFRS